MFRFGAPYVPSMDWSIDTRPDGGTLGVAPRGELDLLTAPLLAHALRDAERAHEGPVVLDLRDVTFMDSSGLAVVLEAVARSRTTGRGFTLRIASSGVVLRVIQLADLLDELPVVQE